MKQKFTRREEMAMIAVVGLPFAIVVVGLLGSWLGWWR